MRRVRNRGGRELLINPDLVTIVEPLPGEEGMVVLHFGRDLKAVVRGTLDDFGAHYLSAVSEVSPTWWQAECACGERTPQYGAAQFAREAHQKHAKEQQ